MANPISFPSIRCHLGDWAYYSTVLPFNEVASRIHRATEINSNQGLDDMIQRQLSPRAGDIAAYLRTQPERFFNAIVVGVYGGSPDWFPIDVEETAETQPVNLSARARESIGILQLSGDERLFAVDGQHRVEGIKQALQEDPSLEHEEMVVLFVAHRETPEGTVRTRRLFTTLNKYAKPVTTNEIIALDEDDAFAVVTRIIVNSYGGLNKTTQVGEGKLSLVKFEGAQIPSSDPHSVTTIQTIYKLMDLLSVPRGNSKRRTELKQLRPSQEIIEAMYNDHEIFWEGLREHIPAMSESLGSEPADRMAERHRYPEGGHILFRPVGQQAFARALRILLDRDVHIQQGIKALASTQLMLDQAPWPHVMWNPSRKAMNRTNPQLAESLLLHMVHEDPANSSFQLEAEYQKVVGDPSSKLAEIPKGQPAT